MNLSEAFLKNRKTIQLLTLVFLTAGAYLNSFSASFHFDDTYAILEDDAIKSLQNLPSILSDVFGRPILRATFAINYAISGTEVFGYHLVNLVLHVLAAIAVWFACSEIRERLAEKDLGKANGLALFPFLSSLLFALHPLQTGSVTYIASRSSVLAALFSLLSFIAFIRASSKKGRFYPALTLVFFVLALGAKESAIIAPFIFLAFAFVFTGNGAKNILKTHGAALIPCFIIIAAYAALRMLTLDNPMPIDPRIEEGVLSPYNYLLTELRVMAFYYPKWLLVPFFGPNVDPDILPSLGFFNASTMAATAEITAIIATAIFLRRHCPLVSFGIFWYFIALVPTSTIYPLGDVAVERHLYLPSVGFFIAAGFLLSRLKDSAKARRLGKALLAAYAILFASLFYFTVMSNYVWRSELTLWEDAALKTPDKLRVLNNRAWGRYLSGDEVAALALYNDLLRRFPEYPFAHNNIGAIYLSKEELPSAITAYGEAVRLRPDAAPFRMNLAAAYDRA
ncbi:MAG: hypothetical protein WA162_03195, partial [Thermodesulfobacteriota bacterium]